jgi:transposase-like protein
MGRQPITQNLYEALVAAFRENPGVYTAAAKKCGCDARTARRAWLIGWRTKKLNCPAIKLMLEEEQERARFERQKAFEERQRIAQEQREKAMQDAVAARTDEARAADAARKNSLAMAVIINRLFGPVSALSDMLVAEYRRMAASGSVDPGAVEAIIRQTAQLTARANEAIKTAFEIERLRVGDPGHFLNPQKELDAITPEQAARELERIARTIARARQDGVVDTALLSDDGGGSTSPRTLQ